MVHILRTEVLPDELKLLFFKPVLFSICFNVLLKIIFICIVIVISEDEFYLFYNLPVLSLEIINHLVVLATPLKHAKWTFDDFDLAAAAEVWIRCGICYKGKTARLKIVTWRLVHFWLTIVAVIMWFYPLGLYTSATGQETVFGISYAGKSSCQKNIGAEGVYNDKGVFPVGQWLQFSADAAYTFCPLDQQWATPNLQENLVRGFDYLATGRFQINCLSPNNPGYIGNCEGSFPDPSLGIPGPIVAGSSTTETTFCPGNTPLPNCFNSQGVSVTCRYCTSQGRNCYNIEGKQINCDLCTLTSIPGRPQKICPVCLDYYRWMSGDLLGPGEDYLHCPPYNPSQANNIFCYFCPGRGSGWHPNAAYTTDLLVTIFWLMTTYTVFIPFLDFIIFSSWVGSIKKKRFKIKQ